MSSYHIGDYNTRRSEALNQARTEDLRFMAETGETFARAAYRLGINERSLERWCIRHGLNDLVREMRARETKYLVDLSEIATANANRRYGRTAS